MRAWMNSKGAKTISLKRQYRFTPELNEKEVIELLENATPQRKPQNMAWKYFKVKIRKLYFDNFKSIRVSQSETMQVETIYTFKNYLYIAYPVSSHEVKWCLISWERF